MSTCSKVVQGFATAANLLCDVSILGEAVDALAEATDRGEHTMVETATVVNSLALLGFSIAEIGLLLSGQKSEVLQKLKSIEMTPRILNIPLQCMLQLNQIAIADTIDFRSVIRLWEKGCVAPLADVDRTAASAAAYYEQHFLDMTPAELKKARRPICEQTCDGENPSLKPVRYKPVDLEECRKNLERLHMQFVNATIKRVGAQTGVREMVVCDVVLPTIQRLAAYFGMFRPIGEGHDGEGHDGGGPGGHGGPGGPGGPGGYYGHYGHGGPGEHGGPGGAGAAHDDVEQELNLNLLDYPHIPEPLYRDRVFRAYPCPITQLPVRDPVFDPTTTTPNTTFYERQAIITWLQHFPISPVTRRPLRVEDLQDAIVIRNQIDARLEQYQNGLQQYLNEHAEDPL